MARARYIPADLGSEIEAPSGYYQPREEGFLDHDGRQVLYTLGSACIEASCCGVGDWQYARVEGYVAEEDVSRSQGAAPGMEIDTIAEEEKRAAIAGLLVKKHPGVHVEFR